MPKCLCDSRGVYLFVGVCGAFYISGYIATVLACNKVPIDVFRSAATDEFHGKGTRHGTRLVTLCSHGTEPSLHFPGNAGCQNYQKKEHERMRPALARGVDVLTTLILGGGVERPGPRLMADTQHSTLNLFEWGDTECGV